MHDPADRCFDINGRVAPAIGDASRQYDVAIEHRTCGVHDRIVRIIALGQHGVEGGNRTFPGDAIAGAFYQLRQAREYRRRVALGCRCLADRQRDLALRLREARQRIHDQQDVAAAVAKVFRYRGRQPGAVQPHQRRVVGGGRHDDRARQALASENPFDEFLHFPPALTDQPDDDDVGRGVAGHHAQQHALADAAAGKQADTLAAADGQQAVDRPDADVERLRDRRAGAEHAGAAGRPIDPGNRRRAAAFAVLSGDSTVVRTRDVEPLVRHQRIHLGSRLVVGAADRRCVRQSARLARSKGWL